jgi:hypothetical protein
MAQAMEALQSRLQGLSEQYTKHQEGLLHHDLVSKVKALTISRTTRGHRLTPKARGAAAGEPRGAEGNFAAWNRGSELFG